MSSKRVDLVFSGASTKIPLHVGAYKAILEKGYEADSLYGTSSGSIVAALIACKFSIRDMERLLREIDFSRFVKRSPFEYLTSLFFSSGLVPGTYKYQYLKQIFGKKTFSDIPSDLHIIGHSLVNQTWIDFNKKTHANMEIAFAIHISTAIPILFRPIGYKRVSTNKTLVDWCVDGGISKNFAVDLVAEGKNYIGHLIESPESYDWKNTTVYKMFSTSFSQLIQANVEEAIRDSKNGIIARTAYKKSMLDFKVNIEEKELMLNLGYQSMLATLNSETE